MNSHETATIYNAIAERYDRARSHVIGLNSVDELCGFLPRGARILDVGCGTGIPLTQRIVENGFCAHGIDISSTMLSLARRNVTGATFELANVVSWTSDVAFHGIVAWDSLIHVPLGEQEIAIGKLHTWLRPGGFALITFTGARGETRSSVFGYELAYASLNTQEYLDAFDRVGFELLSLEQDKAGQRYIAIMVAGRPDHKDACADENYRTMSTGALPIGWGWAGKERTSP